MGCRVRIESSGAAVMRSSEDRQDQAKLAPGDLVDLVVIVAIHSLLPAAWISIDCGRARASIDRAEESDQR